MSPKCPSARWNVHAIKRLPLWSVHLSLLLTQEPHQRLNPCCRPKCQHFTQLPLWLTKVTDQLPQEHLRHLLFAKVPLWLAKVGLRGPTVPFSGQSYPSPEVTAPVDYPCTHLVSSSPPLTLTAPLINPNTHWIGWSAPLAGPKCLRFLHHCVFRHKRTQTCTGEQLQLHHVSGDETQTRHWRKSLKWQHISKHAASSNSAIQNFTDVPPVRLCSQTCHQLLIQKRYNRSLCGWTRAESVPCRIMCVGVGELLHYKMVRWQDGGEKEKKMLWKSALAAVSRYAERTPAECRAGLKLGGNSACAGSEIQRSPRGHRLFLKLSCVRKQ